MGEAAGDANERHTEVEGTVSKAGPTAVAQPCEVVTGAHTLKK